MSIYFISDLHLCAARPHTIQLLLNFLKDSQGQAERLYILGDLFEAWIGDDYHEPCLDPVLEQLSRYSKDVDTAFIHGNRDFLIAEQFSRQTGIRLLPEFDILDLYGTTTMIMHGDTLCTDDLEYQAIRAKIRHPDWITQVLALPLQERLKMAKQFRMESQLSKGMKTEEIMDVNQATVERTMLEHGVLQLIHGHTHRPNIHHFDLKGKSATRIVLGDWDTSGKYLFYSADGYELKTIEAGKSLKG